MKYYKLSFDMKMNGNIICHYENDFEINQNSLVTGKIFEFWDDRFEFYYIKDEGNIWTDYLFNDKGWFLISSKFKRILETINTDIQYFSVNIKEKDDEKKTKEYYVANIIKVVDALCLHKSKYFETYIDGIGSIYTVSKYGIYSNKTEDADMFKLANRQEIPIFISEKLKCILELENITGVSFVEINVE